MDSPAQAPQTEDSASPSRLAPLLGARAALSFLTRVPCGKSPVSPQALFWASAWFPAIGGLLGLAASGVLLGLDRAGPLVASVATVAFLALVTGAFHEDGLADSADALGGAFDRPKLFAILKDSRIGSFGGTALILVLLLRITALAKLGPMAMGGLIFAQTLSRTGPVWLMAIMPDAIRGEAASSSNLVKAGVVHGVTASGFALLVTAGLVFEGFLPVRGVLSSLLAALVVVAVCGWRFHVRAGGLTGDFLGATQQLTDATILVALAASG